MRLIVNSMEIRNIDEVNTGPISAIAITDEAYDAAQKIIQDELLATLNPEWHHLIGGIVIHSKWTDKDGNAQLIQVLVPGRSCL